MAVTMTVDRLGDILGAVAKIAGKRVLVGIPEEQAEERDTDSPINNAVIGYIQEFGSPINNIPPRPFLIPGVKKVQDVCAEDLKKAATLALEGRDFSGQLAAAGQTAADSARTIIQSGELTPLSDATLRARAYRNSGARKGALIELQNRAAGDAPSTDDAKPLIDTGQLLKSITYVVRDAKK